MSHTKLDIGRREFLTSAALFGAGAMVGFPKPSLAAGFPDHAITFMVPYPPGGGYDRYVRAIIGPYSKALPNHVAVAPDNVSGAGGARAANVLYRAKPDGYTISVLNATGLFLLKLRGGTIGFDITELSWIGNLARDQYALVVPTKSKVQSVADLQKMSRVSPVKFTAPGPATANYAATLIGTHLLDIRSKVITGYRGGGAAILAAVRGDADATIFTLPALSQMLKAKLVRVVAMFETHSSIPGAEDATTLKQPELAQLQTLRPVAGPPKLPGDITQILSKSLIKAMNEPSVQAWAKKIGANLYPMTAEETSKVMHEQSKFISRWGKLLSNT